MANNKSTSSESTTAESDMNYVHEWNRQRRDAPSCPIFQWYVETSFVFWQAFPIILWWIKWQFVNVHSTHGNNLSRTLDDSLKIPESSREFAWSIFHSSYWNAAAMAKTNTLPPPFLYPAFPWCMKKILIKLSCTQSFISKIYQKNTREKSFSKMVLQFSHIHLHSTPTFFTFTLNWWGKLDFSICELKTLVRMFKKM